MGTIRGHKVVVHVKQDVQPKIFKARSVPFALKGAVEEEISRQEQERVIEPIDSSITPIEWASLLVMDRKSNGKIRLCWDFKVTINKSIHRDQNPIPPLENNFNEQGGGVQKFFVIDLKDAYLEMEVEEKSRKFLLVAKWTQSWQVSMEFLVIWTTY